jgi:hypothetical protein
MRRSGVLTVMLLAVTGIYGCGKDNTSAVQSGVIGSDTAKSGNVSLEIRDFKVERLSQEYGAQDRGRGTLVSTNAALAHGAFAVFLQVREKNALTPNWVDDIAYLTDGLGTIETNKYVMKNDLEKTPPPQYEWRVRGVAPLQSATISTR